MGFTKATAAAAFENDAAMTLVFEGNMELVGKVLVFVGALPDDDPRLKDKTLLTDNSPPKLILAHLLQCWKEANSAAPALTAAVAPTAGAATSGGGGSPAGGPRNHGAALATTSGGGGSPTGFVTTASAGWEDGLRSEVLRGLQLVARAVLSTPLNASRIDMPEMPAAVPLPLRTSIFVREDYHKVIALMHMPMGMTNAEQPSPRPSSEGVPLRQPRDFVGHVLTGPPGCGKSSIVLLVMAHLAHHKRILVYRYEGMGLRAGQQFVLMDFSGAAPVVGIERGSTTGIEEYLQGKEPAWLLWDGPPPKAQFSGSGPVFIMSSPNDQNYHEFVKGRGAALLHLKPWPIDQYVQLALTLPGNMTAEWALERYRIFGGVPRPGLTDTNKALRDLEMEVSGLEAQKLLNPTLLSMRGNYSHSLVHCVSDDDFKPLFLMLASPEVRRIVFEKGYRYKKHEMVQLVVGGAGQPGGVASFAGYMFEQHGHSLFTEEAEDVTVVMKRLLPPSSAETRGSSKRRREDEEGQQSEVEGGDGMDEGDGDEQEMGEQSHGPSVEQQGVVSTHMTLPKVQRQWDSPGNNIKGLQKAYLQPSIMNNAAWDALYAHGEQRLALQYTISKRHSVKQQALVALLRRLHLKVHEVKMVFVVPDEPADLYDSFTWQPWLGVNGRQLARQNFEMEQWVMRVPLHVSSKPTPAS